MRERERSVQDRNAQQMSGESTFIASGSAESGVTWARSSNASRPSRVSRGPEAGPDDPEAARSEFSVGFIGVSSLRAVGPLIQAYCVDKDSGPSMHVRPCIKRYRVERVPNLRHPSLFKRQGWGDCQRSPLMTCAMFRSSSAICGPRNHACSIPSSFSSTRQQKKLCYAQRRQETRCTICIPLERAAARLNTPACHLVTLSDSSCAGCFLGLVAVLVGKEEAWKSG